MQRTPWNPSRRAIARVRNPLPAPTRCSYCQANVSIANNSEIYGKPYGGWPWLYLCGNRQCRAYVGMHPLTDIPLGTLADGPTRQARVSAKAVFNPIWQSGRMTRTEAYRWLAGQLGIINVDECHFGWMDVQMCQRAMSACLNLAKETA